MQPPRVIGTTLQSGSPVMTDTPAVKSKKAKIHATLDNQSHNVVGWVIEVFFIVLIVANVLIVILETVQGINLQFSKLFQTIEIVSLGVFTVEYSCLLYTSPS